MRIGKVTGAMAAMLDGGAGADEREPGAPAAPAAAEAGPPETGGSSHRAAAALERDAGDCVLDTQARLGRGSGCTVFKGRLRSRQAAAPQDAQVDIAVKVLTSRLEVESHTDDAATFLSDLRAEIRIGSMLPEHANLPRFVGFCGAETPRPLVLWELIDGRNLLEVYKDKSTAGKPFRPREAAGLAWCVQLFAALEALHSHGLVHRDVKPTNIMLGADLATLKLIDFGICKHIGVDGHDDAAARKMTPMTGSFRYMAPEVFRGAAYSFSVDVYSGAMVMAFILSGGVGLAGIEGSAVAELAERVNLRPSLVHVKGAVVYYYNCRRL